MGNRLHLEAHNLTVTTNEGGRLLDDVSVSFELDAITGIIGPNGAGKSTLMRCLYRRIQPDLGEVRLDGRNIWQDMNARELARKMAVVLQEFPADFGFSVHQIVQMGLLPHKPLMEADRHDDLKQVRDALDIVGLTHLERAQFSRLSGGEKQRVLIARALVQKPEILVLDEPTNHLDIRYQLEILGMIRKRGITVVTSLHDLNLAARFCDRLILMRKGEVVATGTPDAVLCNDHIRSVFGVETETVLGATTGQNVRSFFLND